MEETTGIFPYHDPSEDMTTIEQFLMSEENTNFFQQPIFCDPSIPQFNNYEEIVDANDPLGDHFFQSLCNDDAGPSGIQQETVGQEKEWQYNIFTDNWNTRNPIRLSVWPIPAVPFTCSCCQVLREINHTSGIEITKLEIHGRLGMICHAILDKFSGEINPTHEYQMFDFCGESVRSVKQFLIQYCEERKQSGYVMIQDPLLDFYEALCVGLDWNPNYNNNPETDNFASGDECQMNQQEQTNADQPEPEADDAVRLTRSSLAVQRERTSKLKLKDLVEYLHLPITQAAKKMDICLTVLKKICRKHGLPRWPYRKIKSIRNKITKARENLNGGDDAGERMRAEAEIQRLEEKLGNIYAVFSDH